MMFYAMLCRLLSTHSECSTNVLSGVVLLCSLLQFFHFFFFAPSIACCCFIPKKKPLRRSKLGARVENEIVVVEFLHTFFFSSCFLLLLNIFFRGGRDGSRLYKAPYHEIVEHLNLTLISLNITSRLSLTHEPHPPQEKFFF